MMEGAVCGWEGIRQDQAANDEMPRPTGANPNHERFTLLRNSLFGYDRGRIWKIWGMSVHRIFDGYAIDGMRIFRLPSK